MSFVKVSFFLILLAFNVLCKDAKTENYKILEDDQDFLSGVFTDLQETIKEEHINCKNHESYCYGWILKLAKLTKPDATVIQLDPNIKTCKDMVRPLVCPENSSQAN